MLNAKAAIDFNPLLAACPVIMPLSASFPTSMSYRVAGPFSAMSLWSSITFPSGPTYRETTSTSS